MYRSSIKKRFHKRSHNLWCFADRHCFWSHIFTVSSNRLATLPPYYVITVFLLLNFYSHLQVTFWVWLFTVFTFGHPPLTYVCHMLFEIFSFDDHIAIFVDTRDNFGRARLQVHLLETIIIWERMTMWSFSPWPIDELGSRMSEMRWLSVIGWNSEVLWIVFVTYWSILFSHVFNTLKISNMNVSVGGFLHCFWFATVIFPLPRWNRKKKLNFLIYKSAGG